MTFSTFGLSGYDVQYWDGSAWVTVAGGSISGNNKVWRKISFSSITTSKIRVLTNTAVDNGYSRITEVEAWGSAAGSSSTASINWLVTDQLGTPRMVFDQSGSLATVKRHDYAPFGEELFNGARTTALGYGASDGVRQKFTQKERDIEFSKPSMLKQQETNKAFVLMQYFGYLRRNPNDAPEAGLNFDGYNFWLGKLEQFNGNFVNAEMVKAFIVSGEYRQRFGP